jgi:hypothetical protein
LVSCLDPLVYLLPNTSKLFSSPIGWLWACMKNIITAKSSIISKQICFITCTVVHCVCFHCKLLKSLQLMSARHV